MEGVITEKETTKLKVKKERKKQEPLQTCLNSESNNWEIGIDEAGRGPLFGRVYSAAVVLPKDTNLFDHSLMKDSKKFSSKKKITEVAEYIKKNALAYYVSYEDESTIDKINILQSTFKSMHNSIRNILSVKPDDVEVEKLLVDGNNFKPYTYFKNNRVNQLNHVCIEGGDNKYTSIAAASILAKVERDKYIKEICDCYKKLDTYYGLESNKGYGTAKHMEGIKKFGISPWHRTTYGCCKQANVNTCDFYL